MQHIPNHERNQFAAYLRRLAADFGTPGLAKHAKSQAEYQRLALAAAEFIERAGDRRAEPILEAAE